MDTSLADALLTRLYEYDFELQSEAEMADLAVEEGARVLLRHQRGEQPFDLIYSPDMTVSASLDRFECLSGETPILVVGPRIAERSAEVLRRIGVNYLDGGGNAFISYDGVLLDVRGRKPAKTPVGYRSARNSVNLMSPRRAQVIFAILSWEHLLDKSVRALAASSKVSVGQAQDTLELLTQLGYLSEDRQMRKSSRETLLEQWVRAYPTGLGAKQRRLTLQGDAALPLESETPLFVSGESAAPTILRAETLSIYSAIQPDDLIRARRWRKDEERPNIFLNETFWKAPTSTSDQGTNSAPPLLVYADLLAAQESRQREAALALRERNVELRAG